MSVHRQKDSFVEYTDLNGNMVAGYSYSPFGITEMLGEASENPFKYTGREDDGTGLYYYRARYYSPHMGRFISEDPIRFAGGDVNWYAYVNNSPVNWIDPWGLIWVTRGHKEESHFIRHLRWWWNKFTHKGFEEATDRTDLANMKRDVVQEWKRDPDNPERNCEYPIGTVREIPQNYTLYPSKPGETGIQMDSDYYLRWSPVVNDRTYDDYPGAEYYYPPMWEQGN